MIFRLYKLPGMLIWVVLLAGILSACQARTVEVTRVKILERRVIERVEVTVEVTRIQRVVETPVPTLTKRASSGDDVEAESTGSPASTPTATTAPPRSTAAATVPPPSTARNVGERMMTAFKDMEQTLLSLVQDLNSDPLPGADIIARYDALRGAPSFTIPQDIVELQSIYSRYREQVDYVLGQSNDLYVHLTQIESGEADQTEVSPIHLSLARDAASAGTSTLQGLIRELENFLATQP